LEAVGVTESRVERLTTDAMKSGNARINSPRGIRADILGAIRHGLTGASPHEV
jgi:hypothetical protein